MKAQAPAPGFNLERARILLLDGDGMSSAIASQILLGFGARNIQRAATLDEARAAVESERYDLIIVDLSMSPKEGYEFVAWLRREAMCPNQFSHVLVLTGHTQPGTIAAARDSGANFVIAKPLSPVVLLERINWLARENRSYVACEAYAGPDRRFKFDGPPAGSSGRRKEDLPAAIGAASAPNLSQSDIDAMMQPRKVSL